MSEDVLAEALGDPRLAAPVKELLAREYPLQEPARKVFGEHSCAVVELAVRLATEQGARVDFVREAAWLHDIGIRYTKAPGIDCYGKRHYLEHGVVGRELCESVGLFEHGLVCERHVGTGLTASEIEEQRLPLPVRDMLCRTLEERLICYADQFFSKSTPAMLTYDEVYRRVRKHGEASVARLEAFYQEFGLPDPEG